MYSTMKSPSSSANDPYTSTRGYAGSSDFHTGMGDPQNRFRLIDQSRALDSHLPNEPSLTCAGVQLICWFSSTIRSRNRVTATNHDDTALYTSGVSQRQQCGYEWVYVSCRSTTPRSFSSRITGLFTSNTCSP